jgi:hypothetical protein
LLTIENYLQRANVIYLYMFEYFVYFQYANFALYRCAAQYRLKEPANRVQASFKDVARIVNSATTDGLTLIPSL